MITPIQRSTLYEDIARRITEMIRSGQLKSGDKLPTEQELAQIFNVGRGTVREALKSLQMLKIIRSKTGVGALVTDNAMQLIESSDLVSLLHDDRYINELVDARYVLEPLLVTMAVENASDEEIKKLFDVVEQMSRCTTKEELIPFGYAFHTAIAAMSGNRILTGFYNSISAQLLKMRDLDSVTTELYIGGIAEHQSIARAIRDRKADEAAALMKAHLSKNYHEYIKEAEDGR